jgi:hypothetical protein
LFRKASARSAWTMAACNHLYRFLAAQASANSSPATWGQRCCICRRARHGVPTLNLPDAAGERRRDAPPRCAAPPLLDSYRFYHGWLFLLARSVLAFAGRTDIGACCWFGR